LPRYDPLHPQSPVSPFPLPQCRDTSAAGLVEAVDVFDAVDVQPTMQSAIMVAAAN
jgi:hypothetical protein